jgi:hypothetical protein
MMKLRPAADVPLPASARKGRDGVTDATDVTESKRRGGAGERAASPSGWEQPVSEENLKEVFLVKNITKKFLSLAFVFVMVLGLVGAACAAVGAEYPPNPNSENLWSLSYDSEDPWMQTLDIVDNGTVVSTDFQLGVNTIEIIAFENDTYYLTLHPEYFGPEDNPYDDQNTAQYAMQLQRLYVMNPVTGQYVDSFFDGFPKFPREYVLGNSTDGYYYAKCLVFSSIEKISTGDVFDANWNGAEIYLRIPQQVWPN